MLSDNPDTIAAGADAIAEHLTDEPLDGLPFFERMYRYLGGGHYGLSWHTTE